LTRYVIREGATLLVDGPAFVTILGGRVEILGVRLKTEGQVVVQTGRRIPISALRRSVLDVRLGDGGAVKEVETNVVPSSWMDVAEKVLGDAKPIRVMVIGGVDSGKTSFCTYLANRLASAGLKVGVIDADLGQSDVGPPTTIGLGLVDSPIVDLSKAEVVDAFLVGTTSPGRSVEQVLCGVEAMVKRAGEMKVDALIINTDGWVEGKEAAEYKRRLVEVAKPDLIVGMQREGELEDVLGGLGGWRVVQVEVPPTVKRRNRENRRLMRELSYRRYLEGARIQSYPISWVELRGNIPDVGSPASEERVKLVTGILGFTPLHCEETPRCMLLVLGKGQEVSEERLRALEDALGKEVRVMREGEERGALVSLHGDDGRFLGIGVLRGIDFRRRVLRIYTPVEGKVSVICVGCVRLDEDGREIGFVEEPAKPQP